MKPIAILLAASLAPLTLSAADAARASTLVVQGQPDAGARITELRTHEDRTVRADAKGQARFGRLRLAVYGVESTNAGAPYAEVTEADVAARQVPPDEGGPVSSMQRWQSPFSGSIGAVAGVEWIDLPRVAIGAVFPDGLAGEPRALLRSDGRIAVPTGGLRLGYRLGTLGRLHDLGLVAAYGHLRGDADASASAPGDWTAITYHRPAPGGSTGIAATGFSASEEVEVAAHRGTLGVAGSIPLGKEGRVALSPFVGLEYERFEQDYSGRILSPSLGNGVRSSTEQSVDETLVGPSVGAQLIVRPVRKLVLRFGGKIDLLHRSADLDSLQRSRCEVCFTDPVHDVRIADENDGWTYRLHLTAGIEHSIGERLSIGAETGLRHLGERSTVRNPVEVSAPGLIDAPHIDTESATDGYAVVRLQLHF